MSIDPTTGAVRSTTNPASSTTTPEPRLESFRDGGGTLDADRLAGAVRERAGGDPEAQRTLAAQLENGMTPVERGQFQAALEGANDNGRTVLAQATPPATTAAPGSGNGRMVDGQPYRIGDPNAPRVADWGNQPEGSGYRETWNSVSTRLGTTDAATVTAEIERQLYATPAAAATAPTASSQPPQAGDAQPTRGGTPANASQEGIGSFLEGAILGDFSDNQSWSRTGGQIAMGFVPIAGQIADARDTAAAIGQVWKGEEGGWFNLGTAAIGWVPGFGDAIKAGLRAGRQATNVGGEVAEQVIRRGADEGAPVLRRGADEAAPIVRRNADETAPVVRRNADEGGTAVRRNADEGGDVVRRNVDEGGSVRRTADDAAPVRRNADEAGDAVRAADALPVRRFDNADDFNRAANNAAPNTIYEFGNYRYTTDAQGRVAVAEGRATIDPVGRNDEALQRRIGNEGRDTDVGFHVIADILGGQTNRLNVVPGNGRRIDDGQPNLNTGQYGRFERAVRELAADPNKNVEIRVEMRYADGNTTNRPDDFVAMFRVDGGRWREQTLTNK